MEQKFSDLVENADDVICTGDLEGNLISMNRAAERISGYSTADVLGLPFGQFVAPEYRPMLKQMTELKLSGRESTVYEVELLTKDGRRIPIELNTRLMYANGKPVGFRGSHATSGSGRSWPTNSANGIRNWRKQTQRSVRL